MRATLAAFVVTLGVLATTPPVLAQERSQETVALDVIGAAIGGGVFGVAGLLTRYAIEDTTKRRSYDVTPPAAMPVSPVYAYSAPHDGWSGVRYNKPCENFDPTTGLLLPCGTPAHGPVAADFPAPTVRRFKAPAYSPHVATSRAYRGEHARARTIHAYRGGHR